MLVALMATTACGSDSGGDDGSDVDPRAMACSTFSDDHDGYTFDGGNCVFAVDDLAWSHPDHIDLPPNVPPPPDVPWIISGWDATDPNYPGSASTSVTQVAADTYSTGAMRWAGDGNEQGVSIVVEPRDGNPQWCVWKRCL